MQIFDVTNVASILGVVVASAYVLYLLSSRLVDRYFVKSDDLERKKEGYFNKSIDQLKDVTEAHEYALDKVKSEIHATQLEFVGARKDIQRNIESFSKLQQSLTDFVRDTNRRLMAIERGEFVKIGPDTWMLKGKKDGNS